MLKDQRTRLSIRGETLTLAGIRFWTRRPEDIARVVKGAQGTSASARARSRAGSLKPPASTCRRCCRVTRMADRSSCPVSARLRAAAFRSCPGWAGRDDTSIFVSRGIGTVYVPVRINCPPEVAIVTLRSTSPSLTNRRPSTVQPPVQHESSPPRDTRDALRPEMRAARLSPPCRRRAPARCAEG